MNEQASSPGPNLEPNEPSPQAPASPGGIDQKTWATFCHLAALVMFIGIPFGNIMGPLVVWLIKKDQMPLVDSEGKSALNFQMSMAIYALVSAILAFVFIGFFLLIALAILDVVMIVLAAIKISNGESFEYPLTIKFLK